MKKLENRKRKFLKWSVLVLGIFLCLESGCAKNPGNVKTQEAFSEYTDQIFRSEVSSNTLNMHYCLAYPEDYGITEYTVGYGSISQASGVEASVLLENWQSRLEDFKKKDLTVSQQMTYDIMEDYIKKELPAADYGLYQEILRPSTGIQAQLPVLLAEYTFYDEKDIQDYLKLMAATPDYFGQIIEVEKRKSGEGLFMADFAVDDIVNQCNNFTQDPEKNYLLSTFDSRIEELVVDNKETDNQKKTGFLTREQADDYKNQNRSLVLTQLIPAYQNLAAEMASLKGTGKNSGGLSGLPDGKEYYRCLVADTTGSNLSVEEMQKQTEAQRKKDLEYLQKLTEKYPDIGKKCTSYELPTEEPELILKELQVKMEKDFPACPQVDYSVKTVHPSLEEYTAPAFYLTPPIDDIHKNCIYINQSKGDKKLQLYTTLAHEGFPGHLYQNVMERSSGLSPVRSLFGSSGYAEGWATYVEMQSYYYADVEKEVAAFLQKNQSALLSLYATADMGIHYDGWTLRDTVDFFGSYQITDKQVIKEIYELIVEEPAHYLKYYIGYLEFLNLKEYAVERYGEDYSNYRFHSALMKMGPASFEILKEYLPKYWEE